MARKLYMVDVEDENLTNSASSKTTTLVKSSAEKEVETYGIVEINNNSSKKRISNTKDLGFEKNSTSCAKKSIKSKISAVEDYFDFSFRPTEKKVAVTKKSVAEKKSTKAKTTKKENSAIVYTARTEELERQVPQFSEICERIALDACAERIVSVARMGALFE